MKKGKILIIILLIVIILTISAVIVWTKIEANLEQLAQTEISAVDLTTAADGDYLGEYSVFPVSAEVRVTLKNHSIDKIEILEHKNGQGKGAEMIPDQVTAAQSLKVDSVSGATYSSKVILNAIRDALLKAGAEPMAE